MTRRHSIIFFGMGPVALESISYLSRYFDLELIVTKPDQRASRSAKQSSTVSDWAQAHIIPVLEVSRADELDKKLRNYSFTSQVGIVVDFGIIITKSVINRFPLGILNSHFSLLPEWRGADPITFALLSGQTHTGVSIMRIVPALDEGDLLIQKELIIKPDTTTPQLTKDLVDLSNKLLVSVIPRYIAGSVKLYPQDLSRPVTYSRKVHKENGRIDWKQPAETIERQVRAFSGWPGSFTELDNIRLILTRAHVETGTLSAGKAYQTPDRQLVFGTGKGVLVVDRLKPEGKMEMAASAYLNGRKKPLALL